MPMLHLPLLASLLLTSTPVDQNDLNVERHALDNGLRVRMVTVPDATTIALLTLFDVGDFHDPPGRSGMGHFIEHVYITAAAGETPARTVQEYMTAYGGQANAQTGHDYTVFASVSESWKLEEELRDAAARMSDLRIEPDDLARELPRIEAELHNMYEAIPDLAALNRLRSTLHPKANGAHRGGDMDELRRITADDLRDYHARYYKPRNAQLIIVGGFDPAKARGFIDDFFGEIASGETPSLSASPDASLPMQVTQAVPKTPSGSWPHQIASIGYRPPAVNSEHFPAFVVWWGLLNQHLRRDIGAYMMNSRRGIMGPAPMTFAPLDEPLLISFGRPVEGESTPEQVIDALQAMVDEAGGGAADQTLDALTVLRRVAAFYGLSSQQRQLARVNPYLTAFIIGRHEQMGIDPDALRAAVSEVTAADIKRCIAELFDPSHRASVVITVE